MKTPAKKSTEKSTICDFLLMFNSNRGRITLRGICVCRVWKLPVLHLQRNASNINKIYASLKRTFRGLQFWRWQYRSTFFRLVIVASKIWEITWNSEQIRTYNSSRSSKDIDLGANQMHTCNFINSNCGRISSIFQVLTHKARK